MSECNCSGFFQHVRAEAQCGGPQPNVHHEGHEDHEEKSYHLSHSILRVLRALRGEKVLSEMSEFGILHYRGRGEELFSFFLSAFSATLREYFRSDLRD
jgi:hypothetical protein